ncbi:MAG: UbiA family prenyltransferase [Ignavibacteria bacterium]|nr:UbiA family prenyltransferase [Ignavibacteria bacterium]
MTDNTYQNNSFSILKKILLSLIFSNIYIVICSIIMTLYTAKLFSFKTGFYPLIFIASGTLTSYSFHWLLPSGHRELSPRDIWSKKYRLLLLLLLVLGSAGTIYSMFILKEHLLKLIPLIFLTFLYSSGKLPKGPFLYLRKYFFGKTIYLSIMWALVTVYLPLAFSNLQWDISSYLFFVNRFTMLFAICILFDLRDKEADTLIGIKSLITTLSYRGIKILFYTSLIISAACVVVLFTKGTGLTDTIIMLLPAVLSAAGYQYSLKTRSDLWFYLYLDGLMMLSGIISILIFGFP